MKDKIREIHSEIELDRWITEIRRSWDWMNPLQLKYGIYKAQRTIQQNRLYWMWLGEIKEQNGTDENKLHDRFKYRYAVPIFCAADEGYNEMIKATRNVRRVGLEDDFKVIRRHIIDRTSTTKLNTKQMTDYLNNVWAETVITYGYELTDPRDQGMDWLKLNAMIDHPKYKQ